jgi:Pro-kumamolisin, activation domain/Bacterial Ig-like domain (group 3)
MRPNASLLVCPCASFFLFIIACVAAGFGQRVPVQSRITDPIDESLLTRLWGNTHPLAAVKYDRGAAPLALPMERMLLVLKRSAAQETALRRLLDEQLDESSPNFHKWLTPEEFGNQFGPSDQDIESVTSWLASQGFQVNRVSKGRMVAEFSGTAALVNNAFHTEIRKYDVNGQEHWANATDPQIPSALMPVVAGVNTLYNFPRTPLLHSAGVISRAKDTGQTTPARPLFTFPAPGGCGVQSSNCFAVGPYDFATIYNVLPLWTGSPAIDGSGQTIAIVGETDINPQDVTDFRNFFGLPAANVTVTHNGPTPGILQNGEETEAALDVQWSGAVAKGATINFVVSSSTESSLGVDLSAEYIIDNNLAPILSESYGACELAIGTAGNQFFNQLWQQAAAQGITVFLASGDSGSAVCDSQNAFPPAPARFGLQVSGFSSTPYNVSVGGTDFYDWTTASTYWNLTNDATTKASAKIYIPETTWNDTCTNGVFATLGLSTNAETNCNDSRLTGFVATVGGSGGKSSCTTSDGQHASSCAGGTAKPSWQTALTPNDGKRDVPDVSLFSAVGSPSGSFYVVCQADRISGSSCNPNDPSTQFLGIGGTSASSPAMAGIMALVNQKNGGRQGNANYVFYKLAAQQQAAACNSSNGSGASCVFNDVTNGTIAMVCLKGSPNCTTANSSHQYGVLSGYNTGTGFDLATGLGSVNAANLVNKWSTVTFTQSATTLNSVNPTTLTHGQSSNVTVSVAPKSGTGTVPTGLVFLTRGPNSSDPAIESHVLTNGTASWASTVLPGGNYGLTAHYSGDGTYGPSDSASINVNVSKENSQTRVFLVTFDSNTGSVLNPNATAAAYGSPYILRVNVANAAGATCSSSVPLQSGCPSGAVTLTNNASPLDGGAFSLNSSGYLEDWAIQLSGGNHAVVASYAGDASYSPSTGNTSISISPALTTISALTSPAYLTVGDLTFFSVNVSTVSSGVAPSGTVDFLANGVPMPGTVTYTPLASSAGAPASLFAQLTSSVSAPGNVSLMASYNGDANYSGSMSTANSVPAKYRIPTLTMTPPSQTVDAGSPVTLTAFVGTSNGPSAIPPTGTITFLDATSNAPLTGTQTSISTTDTNGNPALQATFTLTPTVSGIMTARYPGDVNYPEAVNFAQTAITVNGTDFA